MHVGGRGHHLKTVLGAGVAMVGALGASPLVSPQEERTEASLGCIGDSRIPLPQLTVAWQRVEGAVGRRAEGGDLIGLLLRIAPALVWTRCKMSYTQFCGRFNVSWRSPSGRGVPPYGPFTANGAASRGGRLQGARRLEPC